MSMKPKDGMPTHKEVADQIVGEMCNNLSWGLFKQHIEDVEVFGISKIDEDFIKALKMREEKFPDGKFLKVTPLIERAIRKISVIHDGQTRKGDSTKVEYTSHPLSVAEILAGYTSDENVIVAGILHDALEDGVEDAKHYSFDMLERDFNKGIADIVKEVTEDIDLKRQYPEKVSWRLRKEKYIEHLSKASDGAKMVCCADKIHNLRSMQKAFNARGEKLWDSFNAEKEDIAWFYKSVTNSLKRTLNQPIVDELEKAGMFLG